MNAIIEWLTPGLILLGCIFFTLLYFMLQLLTDPVNLFTRSIDLVIFGILFVLCLMYLQTSITFEDLMRSEILRTFFSGILKELDKPQSVYLTGSAVALLYVLTFVFSKVGNQITPISFGLAKDISWIFFLLVVMNTITKWIFQYSIFQSLLNLLWGKTEEEKDKTDPKKEDSDPDGFEVYHIGNQLYTYAEADEVCRINDGRLATKAQMEKAHKQGADWRNSYGWCTDQEAYTVSQEKEESGGGVKGGKMKNPSLLLGVNCFGKKPEQSERIKMLMAAIRAESKGMDMMSQIKLLFAELNPDDFMTIRGFNLDDWSKQTAAVPAPAAAAAPPNTDAEFKDKLVALEARMTK